MLLIPQTFQPDSFKISKELGLHLTLYKTPMMIDSLEVDSLSTPQEETSFVLKNKTMQIQLRAPSKNAKSFWIKELRKSCLLLNAHSFNF